MSGLFLSYRRDDTAEYASRIHARLSDQFGDHLVYIDIEDIPLGVNFMDHITKALQQASYVLVAIGPRWLFVTDAAGRRRLEDPEDPVRYEIRTALQNNRLVVPMLINNADMPAKGQVPADIAKLVLHNGIAIRPDPDFDSDVAALIDGLHLDRIDESRVPTVFRVGLVARHLGYGGAIGWGLLGLVAGLFLNEDFGPFFAIATTLAGILAGWIGGWLVGLVTGRLIRHKSPPLVAREVRRMGLGWSIGLMVSVAIAVGIGLLLAEGLIEGATDNTDGLAEGIGAIIGAAIAAAFLVVAISLLGLVVGSGLAGAYFARRFRLRSSEISRWRAIGIGVVWLIGGTLTGVGFIALLGVVLSLAENSWQL